MTGCVARRLHAAVSSEVVVIRSMNGPLTLLKGRSAESAYMSRVLRRIRGCHLRRNRGFLPGLRPRNAAADGRILRSENGVRSVIADVPATRSPRGNGKHD